MVDHAELLPDSRCLNPKDRIFTKAGVWVPIFCANCGRSGGAVPEENMTFAFYLCNGCVETYGAVASTMLVPDEVMWERIRQEQEEKHEVFRNETVAEQAAKTQQERRN